MVNKQSRHFCSRKFAEVMDATVSVINVREAHSSTKQKHEFDPKSKERNSKSFHYLHEIELAKGLEKKDTHEKDTVEAKTLKNSSVNDLSEISRTKERKQKIASNVDLRMFSPKEKSQEQPNEQNERECESKGNSGTVSYLYGLYGFLILLVSTFVSGALTLIPRENSLLRPEFWYQSILLFNIISLMTSFDFMISLSIFADRKDLQSKMMCWKFFCSRQIGITIDVIH